MILLHEWPNFQNTFPSHKSHFMTKVMVVHPQSSKASQNKSVCTCQNSEASLLFSGSENVDLKLVKFQVTIQLFAFESKIQDILSQTRHIFEGIAALLLKKLSKYHLKWTIFDQNGYG